MYIGPPHTNKTFGGKMKKNNAIKAIISLSLAIIMLCPLSVPVFAAESEETAVTPRWTSIATMDVDMSFVGVKGNATATARKQSTASHIVGTLTLYKWNGTMYEYMDEVSGSARVGTLALEIDFISSPGVQYKAVLEVVAYTNNVGEYESIYYCETR